MFRRSRTLTGAPARLPTRAPQHTPRYPSTDGLVRNGRYVVPMDARQIAHQNRWPPMFWRPSPVYRKVAGLLPRKAAKTHRELRRGVWTHRPALVGYVKPWYGCNVWTHIWLIPRKFGSLWTRIRASRPVYPANEDCASEETRLALWVRAPAPESLRH
jgi:hypothetical protein